MARAERGEVHLLAQRHVAARDPREHEQVVDELRHALRGGADAGEVVRRLAVEPVAVVLQQREAEAVERAQRRAQVVRHGVAEGLELGVGGLERVRALAHAALEAPVQRLELALGLAARGLLAAGLHGEADVGGQPLEQPQLLGVEPTRARPRRWPARCRGGRRRRRARPPPSGHPPPRPPPPRRPSAGRVAMSRVVTLRPSASATPTLPSLSATPWKSAAATGLDASAPNEATTCTSPLRRLRPTHARRNPPCSTTMRHTFSNSRSGSRSSGIASVTALSTSYSRVRRARRTTLARRSVTSSKIIERAVRGRLRSAHERERHARVDALAVLAHAGQVEAGELLAGGEPSLQRLGLRQQVRRDDRAARCRPPRRRSSRRSPPPPGSRAAPRRSGAGGDDGQRRRHDGRLEALGEPLQLLLGRPLAGDVVCRADELGHGPVLIAGEHHVAAAEHAPSAVRVEHAVLDLEHLPVRQVPHVAVVRRHQRHVVGVQEPREHRPSPSRRTSSGV